jgi:hypothetical protein
LARAREYQIALNSARVGRLGRLDIRGWSSVALSFLYWSFRLWGARIRFSRGEAVFMDQAAESISALDLV